jgi:hypothetical protein
MEIMDWLVVGRTAEGRGLLSQTGGGIRMDQTIMERTIVWDYGPSGGLGLVLLIVLILVLTGYIPRGF